MNGYIILFDDGTWMAPDSSSGYGTAVIFLAGEMLAAQKKCGFRILELNEWIGKERPKYRMYDDASTFKVSQYDPDKESRC